MSGSYNLNTFELCLVTDAMVPSKFKVPNFEKYNGVNFPKNHLIMYFRKMTPCHTPKFALPSFHFLSDL